MNEIALRAALVGTLLALLLPAQPASADVVTGSTDIEIGGYSLVSSQRVSRTVYQYTYRALLTNGTASAASIQGSLSTTAANVQVVQGTVAFGDVESGATQLSPGTFVIRVDRSQPFVKDSMVWNVQATALAPTTGDLINQDLAAGSIDAETALIYQVFAEANDSRLPQRYVGRSDPGFEATAMIYAINNFASLSAATQQLLAPLLEPPPSAAPGGAVAQGVTPSAAVRRVGARAAPAVSPADDTGIVWVSVEVIPGAVYIEYDLASATEVQDAEFADKLSTEIQGHMWPVLTGVYGVPAAGKTITIALEDISRSVTTDAANCTQARTRISTGQERFVVVAHELTHALLALNFPKACSATGNPAEFHWLEEATAQWSQNLVYTPANTGEEQVAAPWMLDRPQLSLETDEGRSERAHQYGAYLWFLFITQGSDANAQKVRAVWDRTSAGKNSLGAIDAAAPGLTQQWHQFVLYNWNRVVDGLGFDAVSNTCAPSDSGPYIDYVNWDCLFDQARESAGRYPVKVSLNGSVAAVYPMPHDLPHLSAAYFHFDLSKDPSIRRVRLINPYSGNNSGNTRVQALIRTDTGWEPVADWTGFKQKTLCRDKSDENFQELVIVISNSEFVDKTFVLSDGSGTQTKLQVSALGCSNWSGSANSSYSGGPNLPGGAYFPLVIQATTDAEGVKFTKDQEDWEDSYDYQTFKVTAGSVQWMFSEDDGAGEPTDCTGKFSGSYGLPGSVDVSYMQLGFPDGSKTYYILGATPVVDDNQYLLNCTGGFQLASDASDYVTDWLAMLKGAAGIDDTSGGAFAGMLVGSQVTSGTHGTGASTYSWVFSKDGTFDSDQ